MTFYKDKGKAKVEGVLFGNLLVSDSMPLGELYARMHSDSRVTVTMPRLMKVISLDINKGLVAWGFNGYGSEVMLKLTPEGRIETAIRIKDGTAWFPEDYKKPDDVQDIADKFCVGMVLPPIDEPMYREAKVKDDAKDSDEVAEAFEGFDRADYYDWGRSEPDGISILPDDDELEEDFEDKEDFEDEEDFGGFEDLKDGEEGFEDLEDGEDDYEDFEDSDEDAKDDYAGSNSTSRNKATGEGINKQGTTAPRTVVFCGDVAIWADTNEELTSEEYRNLLGITEEDLAALSEGCNGECLNGVENPQEDVDEPTRVQYCYFCGAASDLQANFCNVCGRRLVAGSINPGIASTHLHLVYEEPEDLPVCRRQVVDNLYQRNMLNSMDVLYSMLEGLGFLD